MNIKKAFLAGAFAVSTFALVGDAFAKTLRYAEFGPNRGTRAQALNWFADELKKRSNGELEIEFHWGKSLLGTKAVLQGLSDGVADMGSVIGFFTPKKLRGYNIGDLPVNNSDEWVGMRALYEFATTNDTMKKEFANQGIHYVTNYTTGPIQLICTKQVNSLGDLNGVKLRGSGPYGKTFADFGADVQRMGQAKVYQALESGLVECNQNYYYSMKAYKQYEVAPHVVELDWGQNMAFGIMMNKGSWEGLNEGEQKLISDLGSEFVDYIAKLMIDGKSSNKEAMVDGIEGNKINVVNLADEERGKLLDGGKKYVKAWVSEASEQGYDGKALLAAYESLITKYADEKKAKGYPWTH